MAEHTETESMPEHYKKMVVRGLAAALLLAILSIAEYVLAAEVNPKWVTWAMVPFMIVKGWVILDMFMHVRALKHGGSH